MTEIELDMKAMFGKKDAVKYNQKQKNYEIFCNEVDRDDPERRCTETTTYFVHHLKTDEKHRKDEQSAKYLNSFKVCMH